MSEPKVSKGILTISVIMAVISFLVALLLNAVEAKMWYIPLLLLPITAIPVIASVLDSRQKAKMVKRAAKAKPVVISCVHCGNRYWSTISNCPECAEPTPEIKTEDDLQEEIKANYRNSFIVNVITGVIGALLFAAMLAFIICFYFLLTETVIIPFLPIFAVFAALGVIAAIAVLATLRKDKKWRNIQAQFHADETSICPNCGSHDLSFGRKGYDWNYAFWGSIFSLRGSQYIAGMDSRRVIAHCNKCGHSWKTSREWLR